MVVKPSQFVGRNPRSLIQPAIQCRSREYLRIIYEPEYEYTAPEHLERLRARGLGQTTSEVASSIAMRDLIMIDLKAIQQANCIGIGTGSYTQTDRFPSCFIGLGVAIHEPTSGNRFPDRAQKP